MRHFALLTSFVEGAGGDPRSVGGGRGTGDGGGKREIGEK